MFANDMFYEPLGIPTNKYPLYLFMYRLNLFMYTVYKPDKLYAPTYSVVQ